MNTKAPSAVELRRPSIAAFVNRASGLFKKDLKRGPAIAARWTIKRIGSIRFPTPRNREMPMEEQLAKEGWTLAQGAYRGVSKLKPFGVEKVSRNANRAE